MYTIISEKRYKAYYTFYFEIEDPCAAVGTLKTGTEKVTAAGTFQYMQIEHEICVTRWNFHFFSIIIQCQDPSPVSTLWILSNISSFSLFKFKQSKTCKKTKQSKTAN